MTRVKIYFHRHHRECVNLPTVPVKIPPIVHISRPSRSSERTKIPYSQANHHTASYTEKEKKKEKKVFSDVRILCIQF